VTELEAMIALNMLPDIGPLRMARLVQYFKTALNVLNATTAELCHIEGIGPRIAATIRDWKKHGDPGAELELAQTAGIEILAVNDERYPALLAEIPDPPPLIYVRGKIEALQNNPPNLAVVGTRRPSDYGRKMARHFGESAALAGITVVSGLARGIDTVVQQATVDGGGQAVAVLGSGLGHIYPQENVTLARQIAETGAVISEFPMRTAPSRLTFPVRNRLIAGLCLHTLVVEAAYKSGALITAEQALEQGRNVMAVPGQADNPQSRGCHALIRDGALLVERFNDVMDEISMPKQHSEQTQTQKKTRAPQNINQKISNAQTDSTPIVLSEIEQTVIAGIPDGGTELDAMIADSKLGIAKIMSCLTQLEMKGIVERLAGNRIAKTTKSLAFREKRK